MDIKNYHALGFDLDFTFIKYKDENLTKLIHETISKILIDLIPNFPECEKTRFCQEITREEIDIIGYKGFIYDAMNSCYVIVRITESHVENPSEVLNDHRPSKYSSTQSSQVSSSNENLEKFENETANSTPQKTLAKKTISSESNSSTKSTNSSGSDSMCEDFDIPETTTCKVIKLFRGFDQFTTDVDEIKKVYKQDCDFLFFKRLVNRSTICKNWHPKEKMMFTVIDNNFEFGCFAAHMKLLGLFHKGCFSDTNFEMKDLTKFFKQAIEKCFGNYDSLYYEKLYANPENYLVKNNPVTLEKLANLTASKDADTLTKHVFLATNSPPHYSKFLLNYCVGPEWYQNFSLVLFRCKKPNFFILSNTFQSLNRENFAPIKNTTNLSLRTNLTMNEGYFSGGFYRPVNDVFARNLNLTTQILDENGLKVLYFGDSIVSDIAANFWDSCYVETDWDTPDWVEALVKVPGKEDGVRRYHLIEYVRKYYSNKSVKSIDDV